MLPKSKVLYQVKLILDCLPEDEYKLISPETINYINDNFEYDANISIDPNIPLENQKIDDKTYEMLDKIVKSTETIKKDNKGINQSEMGSDLDDGVEANYNLREENIRLEKLVEMLEKENSKIPKAKDLISEYKEALKQREDEIEKLKKDNQDLYNCIQRLPKIIKKIFIKDLNIKSLNS